MGRNFGMESDAPSVAKQVIPRKMDVGSGRWNSVSTEFQLLQQKLCRSMLIRLVPV